jgi:hypothetical protein
VVCLDVLGIRWVAVSIVVEMGHETVLTFVVMGCGEVVVLGVMRSEMEIWGF